MDIPLNHNFVPAFMQHQHQHHPNPEMNQPPQDMEQEFQAGQVAPNPQPGQAAPTVNHPPPAIMVMEPFEDIPPEAWAINGELPTAHHGPYNVPHGPNPGQFPVVWLFPAGATVVWFDANLESSNSYPPNGLEIYLLQQITDGHAPYYVGIWKKDGHCRFWIPEDKLITHDFYIIRDPEPEQRFTIHHLLSVRHNTHIFKLSECATGFHADLHPNYEVTRAYPSLPQSVPGFIAPFHRLLDTIVANSADMIIVGPPAPGMMNEGAATIHEYMFPRTIHVRDAPPHVHMPQEQQLAIINARPSIRPQNAPQHGFGPFGEFIPFQGRGRGRGAANRGRGRGNQPFRGGRGEAAPPVLQQVHHDIA